MSTFYNLNDMKLKITTPNEELPQLSIFKKQFRNNHYK